MRRAASQIRNRKKSSISSSINALRACARLSAHRQRREALSKDDKADQDEYQHHGDQDQQRRKRGDEAESSADPSGSAPPVSPIRHEAK